jgi:hypothetical protein
MPTEAIEAAARLNLERLSNNVYPGRGIVVGTSKSGGFAVQIYWIMGRSENSRNRVFGVDGERVFTEAADPSKMKDPSLIIYNAMMEYRGDFIVSNGDQTDTVRNRLELSADLPLSVALRDREFEPDAPNFTPRITGLCRTRAGECQSELSLLRRSPLTEDSCERSYYQYGHIEPGYGFCVHTYDGDGDPLPAFSGRPYPVLIEGGIDEVAQSYWSILNVTNRVALAVKFIDIALSFSVVRVINQLTKVG